jgi:hypothetical protein
MTTTTPATEYAAAVRTVADDIIRQIQDGHAPCRRSITLAAGGLAAVGCLLRRRTARNTTR